MEAVSTTSFPKCFIPIFFELGLAAVPYEYPVMNIHHCPLLKSCARCASVQLRRAYSVVFLPYSLAI